MITREQYFKFNDWVKNNLFLLFVIGLVIAIAFYTPYMVASAVEECERNTIYYLQNLKPLV